MPRSVVSQPMRWRDGVLRPDRSALDPSVLQLWYRPSPKTSRAIQGGFVRSHTEPMSSLRDGAARSLERKVASYKDGVLARIQLRADAVYAVIDGQRDKLVDAVDDLSRAARNTASKMAQISAMLFAPGVAPTRGGSASERFRASPSA